MVVHTVTVAVWGGGDDDVGGIARIADHTGLVRQQGQVGHRGRQVRLALGLDPAKVARLPDAQLDQPGQTVLYHHPQLAILGKGGTFL